MTSDEFFKKFGKVDLLEDTNWIGTITIEQLYQMFREREAKENGSWREYGE